MTLLSLFTTVADALERPGSDVRACAILLTTQAIAIGYSEPQLWRYWAKYTLATDRSYL